MTRLDLAADLHAKPGADRSFETGEVYREVGNSSGGSVSTPIARYFVWRPDIGAEGSHRHYRLDCFVRDHKLSPAPDFLGRKLADALVDRGFVTLPLWVSWHLSTEVGGEARGQVFAND